MSKVVPFKKPSPPAGRRYLVAKVLIEPDAALHPGEMVALQFVDGDGKAGEVVFRRWVGTDRPRLRWPLRSEGQPQRGIRDGRPFIPPERSLGENTGQGAGGRFRC